MHVVMILWFLSYGRCFANGFDRRPVVRIESGDVSGLLSETRRGRPVYGFEGIPYAAAPLGNLRFQEPRPAGPWHGVRDASSPGNKCVQYLGGSGLVDGDEDCLYVNVYTPKLPANENDGGRLSVLFYVHGGAFMLLEGSRHEPAYLLDKDVILVTFNYRLGPIGFFSTGDSVVPGNNGLKDQVCALKWVKRNIKYFGGNPEQITVGGLSAGGVSAHYHMLSPLSRGLFQRAFSLSGTALCPWALAEDVPSKSARIGARLGCPTQSSEELVQCLNTKPAKDIVRAVKIFLPFMYNPFSPFGPVVEVPSARAFISETPHTIISKGQAADVPWFASFTTHEGLFPGAGFISNDTLLTYINDNWNAVMPHILDYNNTASPVKTNDVSETIRREYMGSDDLVRGKTDCFIQMIGDRLFVVDIVESVKLHARIYKSPTYVYRFGYRGAHSVSEYVGNSTENFGTSHGDDLLYVLPFGVLNVEDSEVDKSMASTMVEIWTSFSLTGVPSTGIESVNWTPVNGNSNGSAIPFLKISSPSNIYMDCGKNMGRPDFWHSLNLNENEHYTPT